MSTLFFSCDWGTSSLRLRLVDAATQAVLAETALAQGIAQTYEQWKQQAASGLGREEYYLHILWSQVTQLERIASGNVADIPLLISGMASASIGIRELPYVPVPFALNGSDARVQFFEHPKGFAGGVMLVSGVSAPEEVMRGEETQLVGLSMLLPEIADDAGVYILPGTHSKHLRVQERILKAFRTYITGELFAVMSANSILKDSVQKPDGPIDEGDEEAFYAGMERAKRDTLSSAFFSVRVLQVTGMIDKKKNYYYLSGLLIGAELFDLEKNWSGPVFLCSGGNLFPLYKLGIERTALSKRTRLIEPELMDRAAIQGQWAIYQQHKK